MAYQTSGRGKGSRRRNMYQDNVAPKRPAAPAPAPAPARVAPQAPAAPAAPANTAAFSDADMELLRKIGATDIHVWRQIAVLIDDGDAITHDLKERYEKCAKMMDSIEEAQKSIIEAKSLMSDIEDERAELSLIVDRGIYYNGTSAELFERLEETDAKHGCDSKSKKAELKAAFKTHILGD